MKTVYLFISLLLIATTNFAQEFTKTIREVSNFNAIKLNCSADVIITQGNNILVVVETEAKNQEKLKTIVKDNTLIIDIKDKNFKTKRLNVYLRVKDLEKITNEGSGDFEFKTPLNTSDFVYICDGSGDIETGKITANKFVAKLNGSGDAKISGNIKEGYLVINGSGDFEAPDINLTDCNIIMNSSGDVNIKGYSKNLKITQTGSGDFGGKNFEVLNAIIVTTGSGDTNLNVKNDVNLTSTGSGDINLKGNPPKQKINVTGSGNFRNTP